ncbi:hypothetical protein TSUD_268210 [Trifolium subterraneum]|uniref:Uncharacterized protein n=1 Tax=Trifolium subterraneum TaxID=3900 RepID=A0A2Z6PII3_TRISU|nr:hypothetical protein TSUD_268210 [Trifolium subterraneum]
MRSSRRDEEVHKVRPELVEDELVENGFHTSRSSIVGCFSKEVDSDTNNFHIQVGDIIVTLDNVDYLLHLPIQERLLDQLGIICKTGVTELMVTYLGSSPVNVDH